MAKGPIVSQVVAEIGPSSTVASLYVRGDDLLAVIRPQGIRFYHAEGLGTIRALTDEAQNVTDRYEVEAFGTLVSHQGSDPNPYLFVGEAVDPNLHFYNLRARWMDPSVGRFVSSDPFPGFISDAPSLHKYLYAAASPQNLVDPTGRFSLSEAIVTIQTRMTILRAQAAALILPYWYMARQVAGMQWEVDILQEIQSTFGEMEVLLQRAFGGGKIDIVLEEGEEIFIEAKGWNWDLIARFPERAAGMIQQLTNQATRYAAEGEEVIYAFKRGAESEAGLRLLEQAEEIITSRGMQVTFGAEDLISAIRSLIR